MHRPKKGLLPYTGPRKEGRRGFTQLERKLGSRKKQFTTIYPPHRLLAVSTVYLIEVPVLTYGLSSLGYVRGLADSTRYCS